MFDSMLIKHCSPTLAGLKTAGLFNFRFCSEQEAQQTLSLWNRNLNPKGVCIRILKMNSCRALIYVYRRTLLGRLLADERIQAFLAPYGYHGLSDDESLLLLERRVQACPEFPHEIGVFLGYPLGDVKGFIKHQGKNFLCSGYWKVYQNENRAQETFQLYRAVRDVMLKMLSAGRSLYEISSYAV